MSGRRVRIAFLAATVTLFFWVTTPKGTIGWLVRSPITLASELLGRTRPASPALILEPLGSPFASVEAENTGGSIPVSPTHSQRVESPARAAPTPSLRGTSGPQPENPLPLPESPVPLPESPVPLPEAPAPIPEVPGLPAPGETPGPPGLPSLQGL